MENTEQHSARRGRSPWGGPVIAGVALAIPLVLGAGTAAPHSVAAHPLAVALLGQPATAAQARATPPMLRTASAVRPVPHHGATIPAHGGAPGGECNGSLASATLMPFSEHMNHAHFQRSPQQQASDIQDADSYTRTHTVLVESMSQPGRDDLFAISDGSTTPFVEHMYHAHFERSPMQQAGDLSQVDSYVKLHTVLVEDMLRPALAAVSGDC